MTNIIIGGIPDFYIYFIRNSTFKSGDPSSDTHQPFNPIVSSAGIKLPERIYDLITPVSNLYPQIEVDKSLEPTTITIRSYFREPFMMLTLFNYKSLPSNWTQTSDTITANFSNQDDVDKNIGIQLRLPDPSGSAKNIDLLFDGGKIVEYRWIGEAQGAVMEEIDIKFAEISENTQAIDVDPGFDDSSFDSTALVLNGGWALWNTNLYATKKVILLTKDVTITAGALVDGLQIQSWKLTIPVPHTMEFVASSHVAGIIYEEVRGPWRLDLDGKLSGNDNISEAIATLASKAKATVKLEYDASPFDKYFQFTYGVLKNIDGLSIPEAGKSIDVTYILEGAGGSVLSYNWTGTEGTDPSTHIEHTPT